MNLLSKNITTHKSLRFAKLYYICIHTKTHYNMLDIKNIISFVKDELRELDPDLKSTEWCMPEGIDIEWHGLIECDTWVSGGVQYQNIEFWTDSLTIYFEGFEGIDGTLELKGKYLAELCWKEN